MTNALTDKVALVTGATSGVGRATSVRLADQGVMVALTGRNTARLDTSLKAARANNGRAEAFRANLDCDREIRELAAWAGETVGPPDILVHCAGVISLGPIENAKVEELDRQYRTNLRAPYLLTQLLIPALRARKGQVVFFNSTAGLTARAGSGAYAATKHGLRAVADSLRDEVNPEGIRVITVFMGRTATPMQRAVHETEGRAWKPERLIQPEDVAEAVVHALALPPTAEITELRMRPASKPEEAQA